MLNLHSGGDLVSYDQLTQVFTPPRTDTHVPLPHHELVNMVKYALGYYGHIVEEEHHAIDKEGARYFGLLSLRSEYGDYRDTVGLRNSHDQKFPIGIAFGNSVFVCSNLSFYGDHVIRRKHTANSRRDLPGLVAEVIEPLQAEREKQYQTLLTYKKTGLSNELAHHAIMEMFKRGVINVTRIPDVLAQWEKPMYDEWATGKVWTLFNAATYCLTGKVAEDPQRTATLHEILDTVSQ